MNKKICRIFAFALVIAFCLGVPTLAAEPRTNKYISSGAASISRSSDGSVTVHFDVVGTGIMTKIGASTIYIKDYSGTTVKSFSYPTYLNLQTSNRGSYGGNVTYYEASSNVSYYAVVVLYASNGSGSGTMTVTAY